MESGSMLTGVDVMMASRRGGTGFDYYTLAYDDPDEQYEEDSIPGMGSGGSGSPSAYGFSSNKLPPGIHFLIGVNFIVPSALLSLQELLSDQNQINLYFGKWQPISEDAV